MRFLLGVRNSRDYKTVLATVTHLYDINNQEKGRAWERVNSRCE